MELIDALKSGLQIGQHVRIQGVEGFGAVNGQNGHRALLLKVYK